MLHNRRQLPREKKSIVLEVDDLELQIESMKKTGFRFSNEMKEGPAGRWIRLEDPDGNPVDLFERPNIGESDAEIEISSGNPYGAIAP